ncbi:Cu2+-exporting ATPase [Croceicoccus naphthovorans]|uniref:Nitrogen fixation protein FixI n=1 Tax=Croceicoccus naphthovorans TaxID=1348774 RepID=A0A0G3XK50_9SPHN|nr:heavy metal translocating P-type ATPase [Croceicoccus naphthovorans]AKM11557.1 nitrogen fixation protein FixI [Croceicoccus naphthovorans]MBB3989732.1 Cu2+-exporting ATPase [Croceicoccus naphthovorans]
MTAALASPPEGAACIDSRFTVPSIKCAGCIGKIERGLGELPGVAVTRVNFSAKRVAVSHSPDLTDAAIIEALLHLGFEAQPMAENPLAQDDAETKKLLRALAVAGFAMMNIMLLSVAVWSGADGITKELFHWLSAVIALPAVAYAGRPFFASAWMALRYRRTNMDVPISLGVLLATGMSVYEVLTGGEHAYFDGAVMLLFFLLAGRVLDAMMRDRARSGIASLLGRMGRGAQVAYPDGETKWVAAESLAPGMEMQVAAGESLAADGVILSGQSQFDRSMLTGESAPEAAGKGDTVHAGTINLVAPVVVRVTAAAQDTAIADIARLMDEAGQSRSRYVRIADRAARLYAPAVHSLAALTFVGWMLAGAGVHQSLLIAIAVLIITCPCALGLAVPAAQVVAAGALMKRGLLIKDGSALERLSEATEALFDKTGTLTLGEPRPATLEMFEGDDAAIALALAQASRHPLSRGLAAALRAEGTNPANLTDIAETPGEGVRAVFDGEPVALLRPETAVDTIAVAFHRGTRKSIIPFSDPWREDAGEAIAALARQGIDSAILSGDTSDAVRQAGDRFGIAATSGMSPADKLAILNEHRARGGRVLMVGDGLNDGPALAAAHVSIAPGTASDVSQQAADAVFVGESLMPVVLAIRVARRTMAVVRQNFAFAVVYNLFAVPIAILGHVTPMVAAIAMSMSSLIVVGNSLRLAGAARRTA